MSLPEPLTSAESDLRHFAYMPLDVVRLRDAGVCLIPAEAFRAAVISWCVAWHQQPAASLPDDDVILCRLLGYGRDVRTWQKLRAAGALQGYVKCSDGRLYHPVVAEKANETASKRSEIVETVTAKTERQRRWRMQLARLCERLRDIGVTPPRGASKETLERLLVDAIASTETPTGDIAETTTVYDVETASKERRGEEKRGKESGSLRSPRARGSRLPENWVPDDDGYRFAVSEGLDPDQTLAKFTDYWRSAAGQKGVKADWPATWRNWCRSDLNHAGRGAAELAAETRMDLLTPINRQFPTEETSHVQRIAIVHD